MSDFKFTKGQFIQLKANSVIHLGRLERNIYEGDVVEFDGFSLKFNGSTTDMPELKAGVKRGWLSVVEGSSELPSEVVVVEKVPAPVATPRKEMEIQRVYDEEKSVSEINKPVKEEKKKFPLVVENQDEDIIPVAKIEDDSGASINYSSTEGEGVSESQGATNVSSIKLKTAANTTTVISDGSQASAEISKLDNMEANVTKTASQVEETTVNADDFFDELQEEVDDQDIENAQILQAIDGDVQPQQGAVAIGKDESKVKLLPSGVEWDTSKHWSKRAKIAIDMYGDNPEILNEIISVESKGVASAIQKAMK